jgi:hypothetical protein
MNDPSLPKQNPGRKTKTRLIVVGILLFAAVVGTGGLLGYQYFNALSESASNIHRLAFAMLQYGDNFVRMPPADLNGRHSWRILLLPYLDQKRLLDEFKLDESWDSQENLRLLPRMPQVYATAKRLGHHPEPFQTYYHVFVGSGAAFEKDRTMVPVASFVDGTSNTILIIEGGQPAPWTKPEDIPYSPDKPLPELATVWGSGFFVAMADGSVRFVNKTINEKTLRAAITRAGGEVLGPDWDTSSSGPRAKPAGGK